MSAAMTFHLRRARVPVVAGALFLVLLAKPAWCQETTGGFAKVGGMVGVTFVPGSDFGGEPWTARLAFSFAPPAEIDEGVSRLAALIPAAATMHLP